MADQELLCRRESRRLVATVIGDRQAHHLTGAWRAQREGFAVLAVIEVDLEMRIPARGPVGQHQQRLVAPAGTGAVLLAGDLMGEVVAAFLAALGDESRARTARIRTRQPIRARGGANLRIDTTDSQIEQAAVGSPRPHLTNLAGAIKERAVTVVGSRRRTLEHRSYTPQPPRAVRSRPQAAIVSASTSATSGEQPSRPASESPNPQKIAADCQRVRADAAQATIRLASANRLRCRRAAGLGASGSCRSLTALANPTYLASR